MFGSSPRAVLAAALIALGVAIVLSEILGAIDRRRMGRYDPDWVTKEVEPFANRNREPDDAGGSTDAGG